MGQRDRRGRGGFLGQHGTRGETQGYLTHEKQPPPQDLHRALGIVLLQGPRGALFLMSEVPLFVPAWAMDLGTVAPLLKFVLTNSETYQHHPTEFISSMV